MKIQKIEISPEIKRNSVGLEEMLKSKEGVIASVIMTSIGFPEQYDCLDEYGNTLAYMRLRDGRFIVECPDTTPLSIYIVYDNANLKGLGNFHDDERVEQLSIAIDRINEWYEGSKLIQYIPNDGCDIYRPKKNLSNRDIWERLYLYEQSNLLPEQVIDIRRKGNIVGYRECCLKIISFHRSLRRSSIPEASTTGLTPEQVEQELKWFKYSNVEFPDHLIARLMAVNWIFDKTFDDFKEIFIECSKFPNRELPTE